MQTVTESSLTSPDGARLSYRTLGEGPAIVIAHGALSFADDYLATASLLADRYRVVLLDRRAYRHSDRGPEPVTFAQDGADVAALLAALDVPCLVFGHSGGTFGALHASELRPPRLRAISLYEPPFEFVGDRARPAMEEVAAVLPGARLDRLDGQGHLANLEAPALLAETIADFAAHLP